MGKKNCLIVTVVILYLGIVGSAENNETRFAFSPSLVNFSLSEIKCTADASLTPPNSTILAMCLTPAGLAPAFVTGRCMYGRPIRFSGGHSFSTAFSFNFQIQLQSPGEGFVFIISEDGAYAPTEAEAFGYQGWLNSTTNGKHTGLNFGVEFDLKRTMEFQDPLDAHVGINLDSMISLNTKETPIIKTLDSITMTYAWIDYDHTKSEVYVRVSSDQRKPCDPILSQVVDLTELLSKPRYVGFAASTGPTTSSLSQPTIFSWTFDVNGEPVVIWEGSGNGQPYCGARSVWTWYYTTLVCVAGAILLVCFVGLIFVRTRGHSTVEREDVSAELDNLQLSGPHIFTYRELSMATNGFNTDRVIGRGAYGVVFRGNLSRYDRTSSTEDSSIAVKRIMKTSKSGQDEFVAEVKAIGRLLHQNLVQLLGWCHLKGEYLIVYDYMPNGNLQELLFQRGRGPGSTRKPVSWNMRVRIVNGVAAALAFLHEGVPDQQVVHRDVKSSNVLLDKDFNARLGDFGLARSYKRGETHYSTHPAGTVGYMAPECANTGVTTEKSDVYSFGALTMEVASGKKPADNQLLGERGLVYWVWMLSNEGNLLGAADPELESCGGYDAEEMRTMLTVALSCCHPDPSKRPSMRQVQSYLKGEIPITSLPSLPSTGWSSISIRPVPFINKSDDQTDIKCMQISETSDSSRSNAVEPVLTSRLSMPSLRSRSPFTDRASTTSRSASLRSSWPSTTQDGS